MINHRRHDDPSLLPARPAQRLTLQVHRAELSPPRVVSTIRCRPAPVPIVPRVGARTFRTIPTVHSGAAPGRCADTGRAS